MKSKATMKRNKGILILLTFLLLMMNFNGQSVFAAEKNAVPNLPGGSYSLTVEVRSSNPDGSKTGINGANISAYQVAALAVIRGGANYTSLEEFSDLGIDFEGMSASESNEAAKKLARIVEDKSVKGLKGKSDTSGETVFSILEPGIYLVMLDDYDSSDSGYTAMEPFLVMVPGLNKSSDGNTWISNVTVAPKIAISPRDVIEVDPPVVKKIEGNNDSDDEFTFELQAVDISNPMPLGSKGGKKQITIKGAGETEFGPWEFTESGTYEYSIYEVEGTNKNYKYDDRVYHLTYKVYYSGNKLALEETLVDDNGNVYDGTALFEFTNIYIEPSIPAVPSRHVPGKPDTGDRNVWLFWAICAIAAAGIIVTIARRRRT